MKTKKAVTPNTVQRIAFPSRKAIMPDWLKWVVILIIFLIVAAAILWQAYNGGLDIIKNPGVFKFKV
ncbi:MAG: hypothetical protein HY438_02795 [DPANN group archaeon]|nr:hypothetical protein [DPANN group archaeon]